MKNNFCEGDIIFSAPYVELGCFAKSVVFMCRHNENGAMGLIINHQVPGIDINNLIKSLNLKFATTKNIKQESIIFGGPVETDHGFVLHSNEYATLGTIQCGEYALSSSPKIIEDIVDGKGPIDKIIFLGYAGWGPGQLEEEFANGDWYLSKASNNILFEESLKNKWRLAYKSIGIKNPEELSDKGSA